MASKTLTNTTTHPDTTASITFDAADTARGANADVKIIYPTAASSYRITTAIMPPGSGFHPGAHWHEDYDEVMRVKQGRMRLRLNGEMRIVTPKDGEVVIKRGVVHDFWRADVDAGSEGKEEGDVVVEEWMEPGMTFNLL
jgi:mannose-6-phosphate isomerase-like protein (cupin superfamily)